jgi:hypothetical protein
LSLLGGCGFTASVSLYFEDQPAPDAPEPIVAPVEVRLSA